MPYSSSIAKRRFALLIVSFMFLPVQRTLGRTLSSYLVPFENESKLEELARRFTFEHRTAEGFEVIVPANEREAFRSLAPSARLLEADLAQAARAQLKKSQDWGRAYHKWNEIVDSLREYAFLYPQLVKVGTYGKTSGNRDLTFIKITSGVVPEGNKPELMITGATHGDELISTEVVLGLISALLEGYSTDSRITQLVDGATLYFVPVVSPDSFVAQEREVHGVDPNRDYPWPQNPSKGSVDCISSIMKFANSHQFKGSMDFHAAMGMYMSPWAYTKSVPQDSSTFDSLTSKMAQTNGYDYGQISHILYIAVGSSADYYYWKNKTLALGVEISGSKIPPTSQIQKYVDENKEATWIFIEHFIQSHLQTLPLAMGNLDFLPPVQ